jgi:hypothetical protein
VPPRGMHRVRAFGLLHASRRITLRRLQLLLARPAPPLALSAKTVPQVNQRRSSRCPHCKTGILRWVRTLLPQECIPIAMTTRRSCGLLARAPPRPFVSVAPASAA